MTLFDPVLYTATDLPALLALVGECNAATDFCVNVLPGHIRHYMSNRLRGANPSSHYWLCHSDTPGKLRAAIVLYDAGDPAIDVLVHPDQAISQTELDALYTFAEDRMVALIRDTGGKVDDIGCEVLECDLTRSALLVRLGYKVGDLFMIYTRQPLTDAIPPSLLPDGFTIRSVAGEHEADALGTLDARAFGRTWDAGQYLRVMRSPAFSIPHELVVVAPDGRLVAFCVIWIDPVSKSGLFEPVGCDPDFQRRGLTRALLYEGMRRMKAEGAHTALVRQDPPQDNPTAAAFYIAIGFVHVTHAIDHRKAISPMQR